MLGDLNDFIVPAQACVNPLFAEQVNTLTDEESTRRKLGMARISLSSDVFSGIPYVWGWHVVRWGGVDG